jgi:REP-associated tyrosine transposase
LRVVEGLSRKCAEACTVGAEATRSPYRGRMPRPHRIQAAGAIYHITGRGNSGLPVFRDDRDRQTFLMLVAMVVERYGWHCYGFCLMTTHYHLLVMTPKPDLARGMQWLNGLYAQMFNRRHVHEGHVFRGRYNSALVEGEGHLVELHRYLSLNPVRAGICRSPREWPWSSYRAAIGVDRAPSFLMVEPILELFGGSEGAARKRLAAFVEGP